MELKEPVTTTADILVICGGGAGIRAAIEARKHGGTVLLVSSSPIGHKNNTALSRGGMAVATAGKESDDSPEVHLDDTLKAGYFINNPRLVEVMVRNAKQQLHDLVRYGGQGRGAQIRSLV